MRKTEIDVEKVESELEADGEAEEFEDVVCPKTLDTFAGGEGQENGMTASNGLLGTATVFAGQKSADKSPPPELRKYLGFLYFFFPFCLIGPTQKLYNYLQHFLQA